MPEYSSSPELAQGKVVSSAGFPVSGATVILFPVLLGPGSGTELTPLSRATTDAQGRFTLRMPATRDGVLATTRSEGALNLHMVAFYSGGLGQWFTPIPAGSKAAVPPSATLVLHPYAHVAASPGTLRPASCETDGSPSKITQVPVAMGYKEVGDTHLAYTQFEYSNSTSTTLGAGISYSGPGGSFQADGTTTESAGGSEKFGKEAGAGNNWFQGDGTYDDQEYLCYTAGNYSTYWILSQSSVAGEKGTPGAPAISAGDCVTTTPNAVNTTHASKEETFSAGVQLSADGYGINLSSQAGWSSDTTLTYAWNADPTPWCGVNNVPNYAGSDVSVVHG